MPTQEETPTLEQTVATAFKTKQARGVHIIVVGTTIAGQAPELRRQLGLQHLEAHDDMLAGVISAMLGKSLTIKATKVRVRGTKGDPVEKDAIAYTYVGE